MAGIGISAYAALPLDPTSYRSGGATGAAALSRTGLQQPGSAQSSGNREIAAPPKPPVGSALSVLDSRGPQAGSASSATSTAEQAQIDALKKRDTEVRAHEQAHQAAGGQYAGPPTYQYQKGPDGANYAIGGEVSIDSSTERNDPAGTVAKMQQVLRAALAPAQPSAQDLRVASGAQQAIVAAESEQLKSASGQGSGPDAKTKANSAFVAQQIGVEGGTGEGADAAAITGTAAAAADGGGGALSALLSPGLLTRGLAAYSSASGLGSLRINPRLAVVA